MANKIGPVDPGTIGKLGNKPGEATTENKVSGGQEPPNPASGRFAKTEDTVELTGRAQLLERLEQSVDTLSPVNEARVAEVRAAIENGEYELDSDAIANAMLRFERLLGD
tara:strand:- start:881 stop:1210 length:330 start_codon:yes stop_codon:yes gene_type:complete